MKSIEEMRAEIARVQNAANAQESPQPSIEEMRAAVESFKEKEKLLKPQVNTLEALAQGVGKGATLGYLPEIQAGVQYAGSKLGNVLGLLDDDSTYEDELGRMRKRQAEVEEAAPVATTVGEVVGGFAPGLGIAGGVAKALPGAGLITRGAVEGAATGLAFNPEEDGSRVNQALAGGVLGGALGAVGKGLSRVIPESTTPVESPNAQSVKDAAETLGVSPTAGQLTDDVNVKSLESSLRKQPFFGGDVKAKTQAQFEAIERVADEAVPSTLDSPFDLAASSKEKLTEGIKTKFEPASLLYDELEPQLQKISINKTVANDFFEKLKGKRYFQTKRGRQFLNQYAKDFFRKNKNLADLKLERTEVGSLANSAEGIDQIYLNEIYDGLTTLRDDVIAVSGNKPVSEGIRIADSIYKTELGDLNKIRRVIGSSKNFKSKSQALNKLENLKSEQLARNITNAKDVESLLSFKQLFPDAFQEAKNVKLQELYQRATNQKGFNPARFVTEFKKMPKELKSVMFEPDTVNKLEAAEVLIRNLPADYNPSGTATGVQLNNLISGTLSGVANEARYRAMTSPALSGSIDAAIAPFKGAARLSSQPGMASALAPQTFEVSPENRRDYVTSVMKNDNLSVIEKAKLRHQANKKGVGVVLENDAQSLNNNARTNEPMTVERMRQIIEQQQGGN